MTISTSDFAFVNLYFESRRLDSNQHDFTRQGLSLLRLPFLFRHAGITLSACGESRTHIYLILSQAVLPINLRKHSTPKENRTLFFWVKTRGSTNKL